MLAPQNSPPPVPKQEARPGRAAVAVTTLLGLKALPEEDEEPQREGMVLAAVAGNEVWQSWDVKGTRGAQE